jgi:ribosomal protein L37AE/L43A
MFKVCPFCKSSGIKKVRRPKSNGTYKCINCDFIFATPVMKVRKVHDLGLPVLKKAIEERHRKKLEELNESNFGLVDKGV